MTARSAPVIGRVECQCPSCAHHRMGAQNLASVMEAAATAGDLMPLMGRTQRRSRTARSRCLRLCAAMGVVSGGFPCRSSCRSARLAARTTLSCGDSLAGQRLAPHQIWPGYWPRSQKQLTDCAPEATQRRERGGFPATQGTGTKHPCCSPAGAWAGVLPTTPARPDRPGRTSRWLILHSRAESSTVAHFPR